MLKYSKRESSLYHKVIEVTKKNLKNFLKQLKESVKKLFSNLSIRTKINFLALFLFIASSFNVISFQIFLLVFMPLYLSYYISYKIAIAALVIHRGGIPTPVKEENFIFLRPSNNYYRFSASSKMRIVDFFYLSVYPMLLMISIYVQQSKLTSNSIFSLTPGSLMGPVLFPIIFVLFTASIVLDKSGLRFVDERNQYIQRLGRWYNRIINNFLKLIVSINIITKMFLEQSIIVVLKQLLGLAIIFYPPILFVCLVYSVILLPTNLRNFNSILTRVYGIKKNAVRINLEKEVED